MSDLEEVRLLANLPLGWPTSSREKRACVLIFSPKENPNEEKAIKSHLYLPSLEWQTCNKSKNHSFLYMAGLKGLLGCLGPYVSLVIKLSYNLSQWA